ncbi:NUDIX hydrolase [Pseudonocardiaceae bacterium YIM PH 21723]|nr:NUDIX hydrolase [Pseudonocardiaceae bacterium YIM PH 21723]
MILGGAVLLPAVVPSAGVLFFDAQDRVLLLRTSYKDNWEIPGGVIEGDRGETPLDAARREVAEELGLQSGPCPVFLHYGSQNQASQNQTRQNGCPTGSV